MVVIGIIMSNDIMITTRSLCVLFFEADEVHFQMIVMFSTACNSYKIVIIVVVVLAIAFENNNIDPERTGEALFI